MGRGRHSRHPYYRSDTLLICRRQPNTADIDTTSNMLFAKIFSFIFAIIGICAVKIPNKLSLSPLSNGSATTSTLDRRLHEDRYDIWVRVHLTPLELDIQQLSILIGELTMKVQDFRGGFWKTVKLYWKYYRILARAQGITLSACHPAFKLKSYEETLLARRLISIA